MSQRTTKASKTPRDPVLNPNHIRITLEEVYNHENQLQRTDLKNRINRALMDANPGAYAPLVSKVDSLKSQAMSPAALKELVSDLAASKRDLTRENNKKEDKNQARIAELDLRVTKLETQRNNETTLATQIKEAEKQVAAKLREDNKIARDKYADLCKAHKESENRKEKMETDGINSLLQMTGDLVKDSIKFIKIHNLYTMVVNDVLNEFTRRFNEHVDEVDNILKSFPLGKFLLSFSRRDKLVETDYLATYINEIVTLGDCSINAIYKERLREIFVNFMLYAVDCMLVLCNNETTRLTFGDMLCYFNTVYFHQYGKDQSLVDLLAQYRVKLNEVIHKKKDGEESGDENVESQPEESQPASQEVAQPVA